MPTFVELPRRWLPDSWFHDGAKRPQPEYIRPHFRLLRALYGHSEAGALWELTLPRIMPEEGLVSVPDHGGVFVYKRTGAIMIIYVDDMIRLARGRDTSQLWRSLEKRVDFKEKEADIERYLGARYRLDPTTNADTTLRRLLTDMDDYVGNATAKHANEYGQPLSEVSSAHLRPDEVAKEGVSPGRFTQTCSSHVATLLFLARVARPDIGVAVQRLCQVVSRWTTTHDAMLIRPFAYLRSCGPISLVSALATSDLEDVQLVLWSDADLCGSTLR